MQCTFLLAAAEWLEPEACASSTAADGPVRAGCGGMGTAAPRLPAAVHCSLASGAALQPLGRRPPARGRTAAAGVRTGQGIQRGRWRGP